MVAALFDHAYLVSHGWPKALACGVGGVTIFLLAWLRERKCGVCDSVYYIPMKVWAIVMLAVSLGLPFINDTDDTKVNASPMPETQPLLPVAYPKPRQAPVNTPTSSALRLQGIFCTPKGNNTAIINNTTVSVGDKIAGYTVNTIEPQSVTLRASNGMARVLKLSDIGQ